MKSIKRAAPWGAIVYTLIITILLICSHNKCTKLEATNKDLNESLMESWTTVATLNSEKQELETRIAELEKKSQTTQTTKKETTTTQNTTSNTNQSTSGGKNLGQFKISAYCHCSKCCGKSDGITATGVKATANRTIAVDPKVIPLGSKVIIDGKTYVAEDTGGNIKGNRIDMYFSSHQEALNWGIKYKNVTLVS